MSVAPEITRAILKEEIEAMKPLAASFEWTVTSDFETLVVTVKMRSRVDNEVYIVEARCDDYKELPPFFEFIHPETGERGIQRGYPNGGSYFHSHPCICVEWNRKTYINGPHQRDWQLANWQSKRPSMTALGDMFHLIQTEINKKGQYVGRKQ